MFELHQTLHSQYGICLWTLLAMLVLLVMVAVFIIHLVKQNRREHRFEREQEKKAEMMKAGSNGQEVI